MTPLKDALYNLHPDAGSDPDYTRGLMVGVVSTVMQIKKLEFNQALEWLARYDYFPEQINYECVPNGWEHALMDVLG